jgi:putative membrane protein
MTVLIPLDGGGHGHLGGGPHEIVEGSSSIMPFVGSALLLLLLLAALTALYLWRQGNLPVPSFARPRSPEDQAKSILAERFAKGDISTDEFMERSAILNWTPGSDSMPARPRRFRRPRI